MTFANPNFWLAGVAVGVPIVLHLIRRSTRRTVRLGTTRFLDEVYTQQSRHRQPRRLLLLFLRILMLLLIALLFMRPSISKSAGDWDDRSNHIILVDRSPSMALRSNQGGRDQGERLLDVAFARAKSLVAVGVEDRVESHVGWFDDECTWVELPDFLDIRRPEVQWSATDYGAVLSAAASKASRLAKPCEVTLITDLQDRGLDGAYPIDWPDDVTLNLLDVHSDQVDNLSVVEVTVESIAAVSQAGDTVSPAPVQLDSSPLPRRRPSDAKHVLNVRVTRTTDAIGEDVVLVVNVQDLNANRANLQSIRKTLVWQEDESETQVTLAKLAAGQYAVQAEIEVQDHFAKDDQRETALWIGDEVRVPIITPDSSSVDASYLVASLQAAVVSETFEQRVRRRVQGDALEASGASSEYPGSRFAPRVVDSSVATVDLRPDEDIVVVIDPPRGGGPGAKQVEDLLRAGGSVIAFLGDRMIGTQPVAGWLPAGKGTLRNAGVTPYRIQQVDAADQSLGTFSDFQSGNLTQLAFSRIMAFDARKTGPAGRRSGADELSGAGAGTQLESPASSSVLARFEDSTPAIIRRSFGEGYVVWCYFLPDRDWGPFVTHRLFTPLIQQIIGREAGLVGDGPVAFVQAGSATEASRPGIRQIDRRLLVVTPPESEFDFAVMDLDRFVDAYALPSEQVVRLNQGSWRTLRTDRSGSDSNTAKAAALDADVLPVNHDGSVHREHLPSWRFLAVGLIGLLFFESMVAARTPS